MTAHTKGRIHPLAGTVYAMLFIAVVLTFMFKHLSVETNRTVQMSMPDPRGARLENQHFVEILKRKFENGAIPACSRLKVSGVPLDYDDPSPETWRVVHVDQHSQTILVEDARFITYVLRYIKSDYWNRVIAITYLGKGGKNGWC